MLSRPENSVTDIDAPTSVIVLTISIRSVAILRVLLFLRGGDFVQCQGLQFQHSYKCLSYNKAFYSSYNVLLEFHKIQIYYNMVFVS